MKLVSICCDNEMNLHGMHSQFILSSLSLTFVCLFSFVFLSDGYAFCSVYTVVSYHDTIQAETTAPGLAGNFSQVAKLLMKVHSPLFLSALLSIQPVICLVFVLAHFVVLIMTFVFV
jgi:hypothetical protein